MKETLPVFLLRLLVLQGILRIVAVFLSSNYVTMLCKVQGILLIAQHQVGIRERVFLCLFCFDSYICQLEEHAVID